MINILSHELVDRIAAGEVVERPAAAVKELVENALDAGADRILVELEAGGRRLIRVTDNGEGMAMADLSRVFLRHATSKITALEDLFHIASLGFRGEALASIGAVSKARITSRRRDATEGACVENMGSKVSKPRPVGCPVGTSVEVKDLFYNVPPRLKFMKTEATELSNCVACVTRFALSFPEVEFEVLHNQRKVLKAEKNADERKRIHDFFGKEVADQLIPMDMTVLDIHLKGFLGKPELGRRDMRKSFLFLNGRHVKDKAVHAALKRAYRDVMPEKFHPVYFLHLGMPPEWVDVNVHPTKIEVRFLDGARVFSAVLKAAGQALAGVERSVSAFPPQSDYRPPSYSGSGASSLGGSGSTALPFGGHVRDSAPLHGMEPPGPGTFFDGTTGSSPAMEMDPGRLSLLRILQIHKTYAVYETPEGMAIVDAHALHERILYEKLRKEYRTGGVRLQNLLIPAVIDLEPAQAARAKDLCFDLNHVGIRAEPAGKDRLEVSAIPALLKKADPHALVSDVIDRIASKGMGEEAYTALLHRMACRAAVKAGDALKEEEMEALLKESEGVDFSGRCPHGRPTTVTFSLRDLEDMFKRTGF